MQSNQYSPRNSTNQFPLIGADLLEELNNPESQLSKDLENARQNALADKEVRERVAIQESIAEKNAEKLEELENELAAENKKSSDQYRAGIEKYNAEQARIAKEAAQLGATAKQNVVYQAELVSLENNVRQLVRSEERLVDLQQERETIEKEYADSKTKFADAFVEAIDAAYDIKKYPEEKQKEIKQIDLEVKEAFQNTKPPLVVEQVLKSAKHYSTSEEMEPHRVELGKRAGTFKLNMLAIIAMKGVRARDNNIRRSSRLTISILTSEDIKRKCDFMATLDERYSVNEEQIIKEEHSQNLIRKIKSGIETLAMHKREVAADCKKLLQKMEHPRRIDKQQDNISKSGM